MTAVLLPVIAAAIAGIAGAIVAYLRSRPEDVPVGAPVLVMTRRPDDQTIYGIVRRHDRRGLTLLAAQYLEADSAPRALTGEVWVPAASIAFVQTHVEPIAPADSEGRPVRTLPDNRHIRTAAG